MTNSKRRRYYTKDRPRHEDIRKAINKVGGQVALANFLGVYQTDISDWYCLRRVPPAHWPEDKTALVSSRLEELTGKSLNELFPARLVVDPDQPTEGERLATAHYGSRQCQRLTYRPVEDIEEWQHILAELFDLLQKIPANRRVVLEMRFGLKDEPPLTLEDCALILGVTRERVRQLESTGLRKLRKLAPETLMEYVMTRIAKKSEAHLAPYVLTSASFKPRKPKRRMRR